MWQAIIGPLNQMKQGKIKEMDQQYGGDDNGGYMSQLVAAGQATNDQQIAMGNNGRNASVYGGMFGAFGTTGNQEVSQITNKPYKRSDELQQDAQDYYMGNNGGALGGMGKSNGQGGTFGGMSTSSLGGMMGSYGKGGGF